MDFIKIILKIFFLPFYIIGFFIPTKKNIWLFSSHNGKTISENSLYLFEYIKFNKQNIIPIFIIRDKKIVDIKNNIYYIYSFKGIFYQLFGKVFFFTHGYYDYSFFSYLGGYKKKYIQLYHGIPLKKNININEKIYKLIYHFLGRFYDYFITTSEYTNKMFNNFFQNKFKFNYLPLGYPRNDNLFLEKKENIIFYMPTFRPYDGFEKIFDDLDNWNKINKICSQYNYKFYIKLHPRDEEKVKKIKKFKFLNIKIVKDCDIGGDLYKFLGKVSILITDYSSVYFDFLLLNRPIIFFPFDYENYKEKVGFTIKYKNFTPGKKVFNLIELKKSLENFFQGEDNFVENREKIKNLIHKYQDRKSCERIYKFVYNLINK